MSLRDQLLKAGLVSEEKVAAVESSKRKNKHVVKKNKRLGAAEKKQKAQQKQREAALLAEKKAQDRELNKTRDSERTRKANKARIRQLIGAHRMNDDNAESSFNFQDGRRVRRVRVTEQQQTLLAQGQLGVARNPSDVFDFPIVKRDIALQIRALDEASMIVLYDENNNPQEEDDWWPEPSE